MNPVSDAIEAPQSSCAARSAEDPVESFHRQVIDMLRTPVPAPSANALGLLVYIGPADPNGVKRLRQALSPSTFLIWLHPVDAEAPAMPERPVEGTRTFACPLASGSYYSDRVGLLVAMLPGRRVEVRVAPELESTFAEEVDAVRKAIRAAIDNHSNDSTRGLIRLRCCLQNLPAMCGPVARTLRRVDPGSPVIVCGAGPSLLGQMDTLRRAAESIPIFAVGHAVTALALAGITPHVVVEGDSMAFQNWPENLRPDSLLVALAEVSPEVASRFHRIVWNYGCSMPFNVAASSWGLPLHEVTLNKTVTVQAVDVALRMGFDRIALVGQDLCISDGGQLHADGGRVNRDEQLLELPGTDGQPVLATMDLAGLHEAIEHYLLEIRRGLESSRPNVRIFNCTARGARIRGTERMTFDAFHAEHSRDAPVPDLSEPVSVPVSPSPRLAALSSALQTFVTAARNVVHCCTQMRRDLDAHPLNLARVRRRQEELRERIRAEEAARSTDTAAWWTNPLLEYVDEQLRQSPGAVSDDIDPHVQLRILHARYDTAADLCAEIRGDIDRASVSLAANARPAANGGAYRFGTFRRQALRFIGAQNKELARYLERAEIPEAGARFRIHWINQFIPYVRIADPPDSWTPLNSFVSMYEQSRADAVGFLTATDYSPARCGITCVAPGNWAHVIDLAIRVPSAPMIIIDPWLDLLSAMIDRGFFLHRLPAGTLILGAGDGAPDWTDLYRSRVGEWAARGLGNILWAHPRADRLPGVPALVERVRRLTPVPPAAVVGPVGGPAP